MKKLIYPCMLLIAVSFAACTTNEPPPPSPTPAIQMLTEEGMPADTNISLPQGATITLTAKVENATDYTLSWNVNGTSTSTEKQFTFIAAELGEHTIALSVHSTNGKQAATEMKVTVYENALLRITLNGQTPATDTAIPYFKSLSFTANIMPDAQYAFTWSVNNEQVASQASYSLSPKNAGDYQIILTAKNPYGLLYADTCNVNVYDFSNGTFILNEGNMSSEQGSLIFISPDGTLTDSLYWRVNGSFLGNVTQDLYIANHKSYIISQNGGGDGMLVVANAATLHKEAAYSKEQLGDLSWPTHIAVIGDKAYIRDNNGVHLFNLSSKTTHFIEGSMGADKNRMAVVADKLFVPAGKSIYVIQHDTIAHTITMPADISGIIKSSDNHLWVACTNTPAQISKVSADDYSILQTNELENAQVGAGWAATPAISAKDDTLYFSNASTKIYRHIFSLNKTDYITDVKQHIPNADIVYNNLAVHPKTGEVYFSTIKGYGSDFLINDITVFNCSGSTPLLKADYKNYTHFPAGIFFTDNYK